MKLIYNMLVKQVEEVLLELIEFVIRERLIRSEIGRFDVHELSRKAGSLSRSSSQDGRWTDRF